MPPWLFKSPCAVSQRWGGQSLPRTLPVATRHCRPLCPRTPGGRAAGRGASAGSVHTLSTLRRKPSLAMRRVTPLWSATDHTCARAGARHVVVERLVEPQWPLPGSVSEPAGKKQCRARGAGCLRSPAAPATARPSRPLSLGPLARPARLSGQCAAFCLSCRIFTVPFLCLDTFRYVDAVVLWRRWHSDLSYGRVAWARQAVRSA